MNSKSKKVIVVFYNHQNPTYPAEVYIQEKEGSLDSVPLTEAVKALACIAMGKGFSFVRGRVEEKEEAVNWQYAPYGRNNEDDTVRVFTFSASHYYNPSSLCTVCNIRPPVCISHRPGCLLSVS